MAHDPGKIERASPPFEIGELSGSFGRYRILRRLGCGAMGTVYLAADSKIERQVALKIPHASEGESKGAELARFQQEARAAARLMHPNICALYDFGEIDGITYITMTYIDGKSLADVLRGEPMRPAEAIKLIEAIARAMSYAHRHGVIHRDLKPANIMLDQQGKPVIMDFGLARRTDSQGRRLTVVGETLGTLAYMAPEQLHGALEQIGPHSDVYSLGVIFYECLTGRRPFEGTAANIVRAMLKDNPAPISQHVPALRGARVDAIAQKVLAKNHAERYASMDAFADAVARALARAEPDAAPPLALAPDAAVAAAAKPESPNWRSTQRRSSKSSKSSMPKRILIAFVVIILVAAVAAIWLYS